MTAGPAQLNDLAHQLGQAGLAGFCATTLSAPVEDLHATVARLGTWIRDTEFAEASSRGRKDILPALPLGIHLEGPFISSQACGAHPPGSIRPLKLAEVEKLWETSRHTLKILTVAPEALSSRDRVPFLQFCGERGIRVSLGHSRASESEAQTAFDDGFSGLTHAWNALAFHHRAPGALGAALGRKDVYIELILDQIHVSPTLIRWTLELHNKAAGRVCFVSDAAPAAETSGKKWFSFGPLQIRYQEGACRLAGGHLAGGGHLLPIAYSRWVTDESARSGNSVETLLRRTLRHLVAFPLHVLDVPARRLGGRRLLWKIEGKQVTCRPVSLR
jgi:N-acetylglucosamine-6-phosphate deacetylase